MNIRQCRVCHKWVLTEPIINKMGNETGLRQWDALGEAHEHHEVKTKTAAECAYSAWSRRRRAIAYGRDISELPKEGA